MYQPFGHNNQTQAPGASMNVLTTPPVTDMTSAGLDQGQILAASATRAGHAGVPAEVAMEMQHQRSVPQVAVNLNPVPSVLGQVQAAPGRILSAGQTIEITPLQPGTVVENPSQVQPVGQAQSVAQGRPDGTNPAPGNSQFQKLLEENAVLIKIVSELQNIGRHSETIQYQKRLHKNLLKLAAVANKKPSVVLEEGAQSAPGAHQ